MGRILLSLVAAVGRQSGPHVISQYFDYIYVLRIKNEKSCTFAVLVALDWTYFARSSPPREGQSARD